jgi:exopolysaccharide biosynthesis WecB/TagA/CpsF family protein
MIRGFGRVFEVLVDDRNPLSSDHGSLRLARSPNNPPALRTVTVGGLNTAIVTRQGLAEIMVADCLAARSAEGAWRPRLVFSSNGQGIVLAARDAAFARAMQAADIVHADGMSVVFASRLLGGNALPERVATTDFIFNACDAAERNGLCFYFLGGREEDNARAVQWLKSRYPRLKIAGRHHGYFSEAEQDRIIGEVLAARPDVVWLGLGKPRQEFFALALRERLAGVGWIKTCGGMFDYYSGRASRAPRWMQQAGLEWLYRALQEPRLAWRYLTTNLLAAYLLLTRTHP